MNSSKQYTDEAGHAAFIDMIANAQEVAIAGHVRPDGDAVGSCLGLASYIRKTYPHTSVDVYLEDFSSDFNFLCGADFVKREPTDKKYDLFIALDSSDIERLGKTREMFENAKTTICVDHHITNDGFAELNIIGADASSTSEVVCSLIDLDAIDLQTAECLYLGIVHDTGVFKHSNTGQATMSYAGKLISYGVNTSYIIDNTFYKKTFTQNKLLGLTLTKAKLYLNDLVIAGILTKSDLNSLSADCKDTDGIIDQLRVTEGTEVAILIYEKEEGGLKVSLRSNSDIDVSSIATSFGGGGHKKAAGCDVYGDAEEILDKIIALIEIQLNERNNNSK